MGMAEFLKSRFIGKEVCIFFNETAETLTYVDRWAQNKEYYRGTVIEVEENVLVLNIPNNGLAYINCDYIVMFWQDPFNYLHALSVSLTKKMVTGRQ
jgi:hypothetical protein